MVTIPAITKKELLAQEREPTFKEFKLITPNIITKLEKINNKMHLKIKLKELLATIERNEFLYPIDPNLIKFLSLLDILSRIENKRILRRSDLINLIGKELLSDPHKLDNLIAVIKKKRFSFLKKLPNVRMSYFNSKNLVILNEMHFAIKFHKITDPKIIKKINISISNLIETNYQITSLELVVHSLIYTLENSSNQQRRKIIKNIESVLFIHKKKIFNASFRLKSVLNL